ncbi:MAG: pentapeptide repeat-containing protein [Bacteroides sp.]|nr:pentapeptide repeat-containing protein [Bacteroides sp.]
MAKSGYHKTKIQVKVTSPFLTEEIEEATQNFKAWTDTEETVANQHFPRGLTEGINRPYLTVKNCIFSQQVFIDCALKSAQIWDVRFEGCDLSNVSFPECSMHRVEFISCKLVGTNFSEATFNHVRMRDCNAHYINLSMSKISQTQFIQCDFQHGSIIHNRFNGVELEDCQLIGADLSRTSLRGIDLRSCRIEGIQVTIPDLKGAIVQTSQALELLPLLGIKIQD